jgi:CBS domain-containing protein
MAADGRRARTVAESRTARDYMSADPVTLGPDTDIHSAMRILRDNAITGAPVVDAQGNLVGILAEKDCFKVAFTSSYHREPGGWVREFMSRDVRTIDADEDIIEVAEMFLNSRYRRFPVMAHGRLIGLISRADVLRALADLW